MYWVCHKNNETAENALKYNILGAVFVSCRIAVSFLKSGIGIPQKLPPINAAKNHTRYFILKCIFSSLIVFMTYPIHSLYIEYSILSCNRQVVRLGRLWS